MVAGSPGSGTRVPFADDPRLRLRAPGGPRRRRLPRRARADGHGGRPADDHRSTSRRMPRTRSPSSGARRGSSTATCSPTSWRCRSRAGWPTSGAPGGCSSRRSALFTSGRSWPVRAQSIDELIAGRVIQGVGGGILVPVGTAAASHLFEGHARPRALGVIGALTFLGMAAGSVRRRGDPRRVRRRARAERARGRRRRPDPGVLRPVLALGLLPQRPDRDRRAAHRLGGVRGLGDAAPRRRHRRRRRGDLERRAGGRAAVDRRCSAATSADRTRSRSAAFLALVAVVGDRPDDPSRPPARRPVPRRPALPEPDVLVGRPGLAPDRLRVRDRDRRRRGVRRPGPLRRPGAAAGGARRRWRRRRRSGRSCPGSRSATCRCGS